MSPLDAPVAPAAERPTRHTRRSRPAVAALALGLASCLVSAVPSLLAASLAAGGLAVVLGVVALRGLRQDARGSTGTGLAVGGIALGTLAVVVGAVVGAVLATAGPAQDRPGTTPDAAAEEESGVVGDGDGSAGGDVADPGDAGGDAGGDDGTAPQPDAASPPHDAAPGADTAQGAAPAVAGLRALLGMDLAVTDRGTNGTNGTADSPTNGGTDRSGQAGTVPAGGTPTRPATPQPSASDDPSDPWCEVLAEAAVARSQEEAGDGVALTGVRASTVAQDHRDDWERSAREGEETLVLSCRGTASWSDGTRSPILTRLVVDETGELVVGFVAS